MSCGDPLSITHFASSGEYKCDSCARVAQQADVHLAMGGYSPDWSPEGRVKYSQNCRAAAAALIHGAGKTVGDCAKCGAPVPCYYHDGVQP